MCFDVLKNPVKAIEDAKKTRTMNKTIGLTIATSIVFGLAAVITIAKSATFTLTLGAVSFVAVFLLMLVFSLLFGFIIQIVAVTLGGKGEYYEGLTSVTYTLWPISIGFIIAAIIALIPYAIIISAIVFAILFAMGASILYRSIKELFKTDMITSLVAVSIVLLALFVGIFMMTGMTAMSSFLPMMQL
jgi:hypothetical protein